MSEIVTLPPLRIVQGQEVYAEYAYEDADGPIDLSDWQIEAVLSDRPFNDPFWRGQIEPRTDGLVRLIIPAEDARKFPAQPRLGGAPSGVLQITFTAPVAEFSVVWQGPAIIAGVFP